MAKIKKIPQAKANKMPNKGHNIDIEEERWRRELCGRGQNVWRIASLEEFNKRRLRKRDSFTFG